jgi:glycosyltransferase involved in cell wall biosynthesis
MHLIGLGLKKKDPQLRWIADFRDPWSEWDMLDTMNLTRIARHSHRKKEKQVLLHADCVLTVTPTYVERFSQLGNRPVELITNGFDEDDFRSTDERKKTEKFTIRHAGTIDELRDPRPVIDAMEELCAELPEFKENTLLEFVGNVNSSLRTEIENRSVLSSVIKFSEPLPHDRLMELYFSTDLLLLVLAKFSLASGNIPGKIFEYLASGNPILAVGSTTGDSASILTQARAGATFDRTDIKGIKAFLLKCFDVWKSGNRERTREVIAFSRKELTKKLVALLDKP